MKNMASPGWMAAATLLVVLAAPAGAQTRVPTQDAKGFTDPAGLKRYSGSVLVYRDDAAYDEVRFPLAKVVDQNDKLVAARNLDRSGQRTALQYVAPLRWRCCGATSKS